MEQRRGCQAFLPRTRVARRQDGALSGEGCARARVRARVVVVRSRDTFDQYPWTMSAPTDNERTADPDAPVPPVLSQVKLDSGDLIYAPADKDYLIRMPPQSQTATKGG